MAYNAVKFTQTYNEVQSINAAHNLSPLDGVRSLTADLGTIKPGTLLKRETPAGPLQKVATGADASGGAQTIAIAGILATDRLVSVLRLVGSGVDITDSSDVTSVFSVTGADEVTQASGNYSADELVFVFERLAQGAYRPWIQGTDHPALIEGILSHAQDIDTGSTTIALVRLFGPVNSKKLIAWTAADGSTTADPAAAALAQLEARHIFPM